MSNKVFRRHWKIFAGVTVFVGIFSAVYEHFAHGVQSMPMIFAFLYPLLLGVIPALVLSVVYETRKIPYGSTLRVGVNLFVSGVATLTVGSIADGVLEIYGSTNRFLKYYDIVGWPLLGIGAIVSLIGLVQGCRRIAAERRRKRRSASQRRVSQRTEE